MRLPFTVKNASNDVLPCILEIDGDLDAMAWASIVSQVRFLSHEFADEQPQGETSHGESKA